MLICLLKSSCFGVSFGLEAGLFGAVICSDSEEVATSVGVEICSDGEGGRGTSRTTSDDGDDALPEI